MTYQNGGSKIGIQLLIMMEASELPYYYRRYIFISDLPSYIPLIGYQIHVLCGVISSATGL